MKGCINEGPSFIVNYVLYTTCSKLLMSDPIPYEGGEGRGLKRVSGCPRPRESL